MRIYEHDGGGKVYYEGEAGVVWVCECIIDNAQGVVDILNDAEQKIKVAQNSTSNNKRITKLLDVMDAMLDKSYEYDCEYVYRFLRGKIQQLRNA
jgi:hypothetical protein